MPDKRNYIRAGYNIPVSVEQDKARYDGILEDISVQGAMFSVQEELDPDKIVKLYVRDERDEEEAVSLTGYIKWQKPVPGGFRAGLMLDENFEKLNNRAVESITRKILNDSQKRWHYK